MIRLHLALALLVALATGCAATSSTGTSGTTPSAESGASDVDARLAALEEERRQQDEEIRALRNELAIARGEAESLRGERSAARVATISIRSGHAQAGEEPTRPQTDLSGTGLRESGSAWIEPDAGEVVVDEPRRGDTGPRPVLRVVGVPTPSAPATNIPLGEAPPGFAPGTTSGLPPLPPSSAGSVAPLPLPPGGAPPSFAGAGSLPASVAAGAGMTPVAPEPLTRGAAAPDAGALAYRAALAKLRDREYAQALDGFDAFLRAHPAHPYVANAHYWRAEVIYAQRRYRDALHAFEVFVQRHATHPKVADALLKMGLCHAHGGDTNRARALFRRVQQEYPDTVAARIASREEAS